MEESMLNDHVLYLSYILRGDSTRHKVRGREAAGNTGDGEALLKEEHEEKDRKRRERMRGV